MEIVVTGAGAAGLMAAIYAAKEGNKVVILEHNDKPGKKIRVTGNGRCNLSNMDMDVKYFNNPDFVTKVLNKFSLQDTEKFFYDIGMMIWERDGYLYPMSLQAAGVVYVLVAEFERLGGKIIYGFETETIVKQNNEFEIYGKLNGKEKNIYADKVIIACGGKASPITGSDGSGYKIAIKLGHRVNKPLPGLTGMICRDDFFKEACGVRTKVKLDIYSQDELLHSEKGELQIADYGISGIPTFNCSRYAAIALHRKKDVYCIIDFLPELSEEEIKKFITEQKNAGNDMVSILKGMLNCKLAQAVYKKAKQSANDDEMINIISTIKHFKVKIYKTKTFDNAQVTCGGVSTDEIDANTMESKIVSGAYFAGEIIDIDGACGGYNLQFAWSSGAIAGKSCSYDKN